MIIREKRLERGWTQAQLAEFSGLNLRTIQRIEKGKTPSMESSKSLAAVFEVDLVDLLDDEELDESVLNDIAMEELKKIREMKSFFMHLFAYVLVVPITLLANYLHAPNDNWGLYLALGWGTWLIVDALHIFDMNVFFDKNWEKRQLRKRLGEKIGKKDK